MAEWKSWKSNTSFDIEFYYINITSTSSHILFQSMLSIANGTFVLSIFTAAAATFVLSRQNKKSQRLTCFNLYETTLQSHSFQEEEIFLYLISNFLHTIPSNVPTETKCASHKLFQRKITSCRLYLFEFLHYSVHIYLMHCTWNNNCKLYPHHKR